MPVEPTSASGLRPTRSTSTIAMTVPMMLMIDVVNEYRNEADGSTPTDCQSVAE